MIQVDRMSEIGAVGHADGGAWGEGTAPAAQSRLGDRTLGATIRARRLELGWTQEELARRIGGEGEFLGQSDVSRLERGRIGLPRRRRLERIAAVLGLPLGELLACSGWATPDLAADPEPRRPA